MIADGMAGESASWFVIQRLPSPGNPELSCPHPNSYKVLKCTGKWRPEKGAHLSGPLIIHRKHCSNEMSVQGTRVFLTVDFCHVRGKCEVENMGP